MCKIVVLVPTSASGSQLCKVPFVLLQPLVQRLGFGVESQGQINVPVRLQGIETEHVGQVLSPLETKLLVLLRNGLETENPPCLIPYGLGNAKEAGFLQSPRKPGWTRYHNYVGPETTNSSPHSKATRTLATRKPGVQKPELSLLPDTHQFRGSSFKVMR